MDFLKLKSGQLGGKFSLKRRDHEQLHKRFTDEQVRLLLQRYCEGVLDRPTVEEVLEVGKSRFFALLKQYRLNPEGFSLTYRRETHTRLPAWVEKEIEHELMLEKNLIDDSTLPITTFNYSVIRERLAKRGIQVLLPTIIGRTKKLCCYQPHHRRKESHDREVVTTAIGVLIQTMLRIIVCHPMPIKDGCSSLPWMSGTTTW